MSPTQDDKQTLVDVCRRLYHRQLLAATDGNVSLRRGDRLLVTPSGVNKGVVRPDQLLTLDLEGRVVAGEGAPTTEILMHLTAYRRRPDIGAVVHAHPPWATACTIAGVSLEPGVLPEVVLTLGAIPTAPYATTGTSALAEAIRDLILEYDAVLLAHHGALTLGCDLEDAVNKMEKVEHAALVVALARLLGGAHPLPAAEVANLTRLGLQKGYRPPAAKKNNYDKAKN